jgi:cell wall assembly regulator SMI1
MSYERLERWLAAHRPAILANLLPPAHDRELRLLETTIGASLPPSLLNLYGWRNGQLDPGRAGAFYGLAFLNISDAIAQWETWNEVILETPEDDMRSLDESQSSVIPGVVKVQYANRLWIPFAHDWGGNHYRGRSRSGPRRTGGPGDQLRP